MIPEFTQTVFLRSLDEWGAYRLRFEALSAGEQADFLHKQGFSSVHDILAHAGVWWEEAEGIIRDALEKRERPRRRYDFDEFNAASLRRFRDTPEAEFTTWVESQRQRMLSLVASLDAEQLKNRKVYGWLDAVTLFHLKEHGIGAPLFLALDMLQREWAAYPGRFRALPDEKQRLFLEQQGFARFTDIAAHIAAWWDEGQRLIDAVARDPAYNPGEVDVDGFNARVLQLFAPLDEETVWKKYESSRMALMELLMNLPTDLYNRKEVQSWVRSDVIDHYFDHAV
ncbi:MAG TPA: hypothetical protein VF784_16620 [Anaerolineales bacterium]